MITYEDFVVSAAKLQTLELGWTWVSDEEQKVPSLEDGYLERTVLRPLSTHIPATATPTSPLLTPEVATAAAAAGSPPPAAESPLQPPQEPFTTEELGLILDSIPDEEEFAGKISQAMLMKVVKGVMMPTLTAIINACVRINSITDDWKETTVAILPKYRNKIFEGSKSNLDRVLKRSGSVNNRVIQLGTFEAKLLYLALDSRLSKWYHAKQALLRKEQTSNGLKSPLDQLASTRSEKLETMLGNAIIDEDPSAAALPPTNLTSWTLHICYSHSYKEPVLYFQAHDQSGTPLDPGLILSELDFGVEVNEGHSVFVPGAGDKIPAVSQEHHPVLHRPFYMLHPCQTGQVMEELIQKMDQLSHGDGEERVERSRGSTPGAEKQEDGCRYLLAWLSVAGRPVGGAPTPIEWQDAMTKLKKTF